MKDIPRSECVSQEELLLGVVDELTDHIKVLDEYLAHLVADATAAIEGMDAVAVAAEEVDEMGCDDHLLDALFLATDASRTSRHRLYRQLQRIAALKENTNA